MPDSADDPVILRAVLDLAPDMVSLSQFSGVVEYVNPAGRELVGLTESYRSLPLTTADFFPADGLDVAPEVEAGLSRYGHWRGHSELRHFGTDEAIPVAVSTFVVHRDNGEPALIASVIRDRRCGHRRDAELQATAVAATHYAAEQKALAELSRLAVDAELPQLLDAAVAAAATLTGVETASIVRYSGSASAELSIESCTRAGASTQATTPGDMAIAAYAIEGGATVVCADTDVESRFARLPQRFGGTGGGGKWGLGCPDGAQSSGPGVLRARSLFSGCGRQCVVDRIATHRIGSAVDSTQSARCADWLAESHPGVHTYRRGTRTRT